MTLDDLFDQLMDKPEAPRLTPDEIKMHRMMFFAGAYATMLSFEMAFTETDSEDEAQTELNILSLEVHEWANSSEYGKWPFTALERVH